jgi:hypothetical protein
MAAADYIARLKDLEDRLQTDSVLRRRTGRLVYYSSALGAGLYGLLLLGYRLRLSIPKGVLYLYTVNPVAEWTGAQALRYNIDDLLEKQ